MGPKNGGEIHCNDDGGVDEILLPQNATDSDVANSKRLFPWTPTFIANVGRVQ